MEKVEEIWKPGHIQYKPLYITQASEQYLVNTCHTFGYKICNQITKDIFKIYPYANVAKERLEKQTLNNASIPGTILVRGNGKNMRYIINIFSQVFPETAYWQNDTYVMREKYFKSGIEQIFQIEKLESIAIQEKIGCDEKTNWNKYLKIIEKLTKDNPSVRVAIYQGINGVSKVRNSLRILKKVNHSCI